MKRIYAFTLKSEEPYPTEKLSDNLRLIAYLLYEDIYANSDDKRLPLNTNKNIKYNRLHEIYDDCRYRFDSDLDSKKSIYYEPFLIGDNTFCITILDELIDEEMIKDALERTLKLARLEYKIDFFSIEYYAKDKEDEKNREMAIENIYCALNIEYAKRNNVLRKLLRIHRKTSYNQNTI